MFISQLVRGSVAANIDVYDHHEVILELFHRRTIPTADQASSSTISKKVRKQAATNILCKLVDKHSRDEILKRLKTFGNELALYLVEEDGSMMQHPALNKYNIFKEAGLIDDTWKEFSYFLTNFQIGGKAHEIVEDFIAIIKDGYTGLEPYGGCYIFQNIPFTNFQAYLSEPVLVDYILKGFQLTDHIEDNTLLSHEEKKVLHKQFYSLANKKGKLDAVKTIPAEVAQWFIELPKGEREAFESPEQITPFAAALLFTSGVKIPENYSNLEKLTVKLLSASVLVLSTNQIVQTLKLKGISCWHLAQPIYTLDIKDLLTARLESVKNDVKAGLAEDVATKTKLQNMLKPGANNYMPAPIRTFFEFLVS